MSRPSAKRMEILQYLVAYHRREHMAPALHEISTAVDLGSTQAVTHHLRVLASDGMIERKCGPRAIVVTGQGIVAAGVIPTAADKAAEREAVTRTHLAKLRKSVKEYQDLRQEYEVLQLDHYAQPQRRLLMGRLRDARGRMFDVLAEVKT